MKSIVFYQEEVVARRQEYSIKRFVDEALLEVHRVGDELDFYVKQGSHKPGLMFRVFSFKDDGLVDIEDNASLKTFLRKRLKEFEENDSFEL